jgi:hypothetical protein
VIGPFFFEGTVNHANYLSLLRDTVVPAIENLENSDALLFQQDGAPPHFALVVRHFLDNAFPQGWIGRSGPIEWPPRSPDITPMDFFLWGVVKNFVFAKQPTTVNGMKQFIAEAFALIDDNKELCVKVCRSVRRRMEVCNHFDGDHFEHIIHLKKFKLFE